MSKQNFFQNNFWMHSLCIVNKTNKDNKKMSERKDISQGLHQRSVIKDLSK